LRKIDLVEFADDVLCKPIPDRPLTQRLWREQPSRNFRQSGKADNGMNNRDEWVPWIEENTVWIQ